MLSILWSIKAFHEIICKLVVKGTEMVGMVIKGSDMLCFIFVEMVIVEAL